VFVVEVVKIFNKLTIPPIIGRIPVGSGDDRSVNQKNPSLRIAGLIS
jgi:hypothetical protein